MGATGESAKPVRCGGSRRPCDVREHVPDRLLPIYVNQDASFRVEAEERLRLGLEYLETVGYPDLSVIRTPFPVPRALSRLRSSS